MSQDRLCETECVGGEMNLCGITHLEWVEEQVGSSARITEALLLSCEVDQP